MASIFRRIFGGSNKTGTWIQADSALTERVLGYSGRLTDRALIREAILLRYGTGIRLEKDATGIDYEVFVKTGFNKRLQAGHIETISIGLGHKIAMALATLFGEPTQNFDLVGPKGVDTSKAADLLEEIRNEEQRLARLVQSDNESIWVGCSPIFTEFVDRRLRYHVIDPGKIQALYDGAIYSNGQTRPTNRLDIEDSTCVVIETGSVDQDTKSFVAIFGRTSESGDYPDGRYVSFMSGGDGREIPDPGDENTFDWRTKSGDIANPLSLYANMHPELDLPEYPIITIHSGLIRRDCLFPVTDSLLQESLEADVAASHIRATSGDNAKGTLVFSKSEAGGTQPVPRNLRGEVVLEPGQKLESVNHDASAPKIAWDLLLEEMVSTSQGYTVPDFYISSEDHTVEAASGVALKVRSRQMMKFRNTRASINKPEIGKLFQIEKALIALMAEADESTIRLIESCEQTWDPGQLDMPEDEEKKINTIDRLEDMGVYDTIEAIRIAYDLSNESEAIDKYEQLKERRKKYPPLNSLNDGDDEDDNNNDDGGTWIAEREQNEQEETE